MKISASFNCPRSINITPRLQYASAKFGSNLTACRVNNSAFFKFPLILNICPKLELALASVKPLSRNI